MEVTDDTGFEFWEDVVSNCEYATFFHTPEWAMILQKTYADFSIATKAFILNDGTPVILPMMKSKAMRGIFRCYYSMPLTLYGGVISHRGISQDNINEVFGWLLSNSPVGLIEITSNPLYHYELPRGYSVKSYFTQMLDLDQGFDSIWKGFSKGHRSSARRAEKEGVSIHLASGLHDYRLYYSIYLDSVRRWGNDLTSLYPFELLKNIFEIGGDKVRLWLAHFDGRPIAGAVFFYHNKHVAYWSNASLESHFKYYPNNLLHATIIAHACENGYKHYDFLPSGGHEGVVKFKKSFGSYRQYLNVWHSESLTYRFLRTARSRIPFRFWKMSKNE